MPTVFDDIPQDPATRAAIRRLCDARGHPTACEAQDCRRKRRCVGPWRVHPEEARTVLPPCLTAAYDALILAAIEADIRLDALKVAVAVARGLPDPDHAAEFGLPEAHDALGGGRPLRPAGR